MINSYIVDYSISNSLGIDFLLEHNIFPIHEEELFTLVATNNTSPNELLLTTFFKKPLKFIQVSPHIITWQIKNFHTLIQIFTLTTKALDNSHQNNSNNSYISDMIDTLILFAIQLKSSDIHMESLKNKVAIRFRIDGILHLIFTFNYEVSTLISSIIKLYATLDISQTRLPQNGRFSKIFNDKTYDFRVSIMPIINGESIVLRILDSDNSKVKLSDIGFDKKSYKTIHKIIQANQGLILVTGPTGSGKTTTLYSILNTLNSLEKKIITVEDPIEYDLAGISQININEDINLTYSHVLKNILRQDPDRIPVSFKYTDI